MNNIVIINSIIILVNIISVLIIKSSKMDSVKSYARNITI